MITPKPYLSWSQLTLWESAPERYKDYYLKGIGNSIPLSRGVVLGKDVATALETGEETGDELRDLVIAQIPRLADSEREIKATIKIGKIEIPLLGKLDASSKDLMTIKEYKTGQTKWTQKLVDKQGQITMYCVIIQALTGEIPKDIELVHIPTKADEDGKLELTGDIIIIPTERTTIDILKMKSRIKKAWLEIGKMCEEAII